MSTPFALSHQITVRQGLFPHITILDLEEGTQHMATYQVTCSYQIKKVEDNGTEINMADGAATWENLSYDDLCKFEGIMMAQITQGLAELGMEEAKNKKNK